MWKKLSRLAAKTRKAELDSEVISEIEELDLDEALHDGRLYEAKLYLRLV